MITEKKTAHVKISFFSSLSLFYAGKFVKIRKEMRFGGDVLMISELVKSNLEWSKSWKQRFLGFWSSPPTPLQKKLSALNPCLPNCCFINNYEKCPMWLPLISIAEFSGIFVGFRTWWLVRLSDRMNECFQSNKNPWPINEWSTSDSIWDRISRK